MRHTLDVALGRQRQARERLLFRGTADACQRVRHRDDAAPPRRKRQARQQRTALVAVAVPAAFDDQAACCKRPGADRRSAGAADRVRERRWIDWQQAARSEEHTSELQSQSKLVWRLLVEKNKD